MRPDTYTFFQFRIAVCKIRSSLGKSLVSFHRDQLHFRKFTHPKCGNPLNPQPVQETPVQNEPVVQTVQSEPVVQQQFGTQPQSGAVPPVNADVPRYQEAPPMQPQPRKKKKKWPIVVAIIAVIAAAAAVIGFVVLPNVLSPDKHAKAAKPGRSGAEARHAGE